MFGTLSLAVLFTVAGTVLGRVPMAVVAGLLVVLGINLIDNWTTGLVGRLRRDPTSPAGVLLWLAADPVRLAATNAVRLAEARLELH